MNRTDNVFGGFVLVQSDNGRLFQLVCVEDTGFYHPEVVVEP